MCVHISNQCYHYICILYSFLLIIYSMLVFAPRCLSLLNPPSAPWHKENTHAFKRHLQQIKSVENCQGWIFLSWAICDIFSVLFPKSYIYWLTDLITAFCECLFHAVSDCVLQGELLSPCRCAGSVRCTHQSCLIRWISERGSWSCELCYFKYQVLAISTKNPLQV